jgi:GxxExxY protein
MPYMGKLVHEELTYQVLGALFKVHNQFGRGYQEKYYQRAIEAEFRRQGIPFVREVVVPLQYEGEPIGAIPC